MSPRLRGKKAVADGENLVKIFFPSRKRRVTESIILYLLSDAGQIKSWPEVREYLHKGKAYASRMGLA